MKQMRVIGAKINDGILDRFPKWEMSLWRDGEMVAYTFSINGLDWKCKAIADRYNPRSSAFIGTQPKITVFSKTAAEKWLKRFQVDASTPFDV